MGGGWIRQVRRESEESGERQGEWRTGGQWVRRVLKMPQRRGGGWRRRRKEGGREGGARMRGEDEQCGVARKEVSKPVEIG